MSRNITDPATTAAASMRATRRQGYGSSPIADPTGTSPRLASSRAESRFDPALLVAFNAAQERARNAYSQSAVSPRPLA